jgi:hypothetical protein
MSNVKQVFQLSYCKNCNNYWYFGIFYSVSIKDTFTSLVCKEFIWSKRIKTHIHCMRIQFVKFIAIHWNLQFYITLRTFWQLCTGNSKMIVSIKSFLYSRLIIQTYFVDESNFRVILHKVLCSVFLNSVQFNLLTPD